MGKLKVSKSFIKEAHNAACSTWKDRIEIEFPELFKEEQFKVGDWVICINSVLYYKKSELAIVKNITPADFIIDFMDDRGVGLSHSPYISAIKSKFRKATKEEIQAHLIEEAKRRYKVGDSIKCLYSGKIKTVMEEKSIFDNLQNNSNSFWHDGCEPTNCQVYKNGIWAEIIQTITKEEAEKQLGKKIV